MTRGAAAAACVLAWWLACTVAAQPSASWVERPVHVTLVQEPCTSYETDELTAILQVELRAIGVQDLAVVPRSSVTRNVEAGLALIHVSCDAKSSALIVEVADLATGNQLKREIPFEAVAREARPRALALAIAVMVETSWLEVATRPPRSLGAFALPPEIKAALRNRLAFSLAQDERPRPPTLEAQRVDLRSNLFAFLVEGRSFPSQSTGLLGLQLGYLPILGPLRLWLTADAAIGHVSLTSSNLPVADVRLYWLSAGIGATWATETLPELGIGPYARFGYARADVQLDSSFTGYPARDASSFVAVIGVQAQLRAALSARTFVLIAWDLGYAVGGVSFVGLRQPWASLADLCIGLRLGVAR